MPLGIVWDRTWHRAVPLGNAPWVRARQRPVLPTLARCYRAPRRQCPVQWGCPDIHVPCPHAAGSAGFAVSSALFSARGALAQQMAGITKQLAAAKPIIYLIMIYHLTT